MEINNKQEISKIMEFKRKMEEAGIDTNNILYCPEVPILGVEKSYIIEEVAGIKVAVLLGVEYD